MNAELASVEPVRLFIEALNARDIDTLRLLVSDDVEFRSAQGTSLRGDEGLKDIVMAARENDLLLARAGAEQIDADDAVEHLTVPVRVLVGNGEVRGTAVSDFKDSRVAAFSVLSQD